MEKLPPGQRKTVSNSIFRKGKGLASHSRDDISPAVYYKLPNAKGKVGIINPISCKFCKNCNRVRLTSKGQLKLCLHSDREIDLKRALEEGQDLKALILKSIGEKEESHHLEDKKYIKRNMNQIGG